MLEELDTRRHLVPFLSSNDPEERSLADNALICLEPKKSCLLRRKKNIKKQRRV
jgi:hypothetical protein